MGLEDNTSLVSRIANDIWNRGDLTVVEEVMEADAKYHGPHMPGGVGDRNSWRYAISMYRLAFPDSHVTFDALIATGDTVVGRWSATGTHTGPLPGLAPTGRRIAIGGVTIYRIAGGRIAEAWEQLDLLGMWCQLGVVTLPGHAS
jgi:predicted ester cyclase